MTAAISMAKELRVRKVAVPSAGNAAGAMAAYCARAGMEAHIFMPSDTPTANVVECRQTGANVTLVDGLITDCGKIVAGAKAGRRLVRCFNTEGAVSRRGQEDHGL
jgi:threonine synthase